MQNRSSASATLHVPALDCPDELTLIERGLRRVPGIVDLYPDYLQRRLRVEFDERLEASQIAAEIRRIGFAAEVVSRETLAQPVAAPPTVRWTTLAGAALLAAALVARFANLAIPLADGLAIAATLVAGVSVARAALRAVRLRTLDMNALMTLAAAGALATGDDLEAATAMVLFGVSLWLESYSLHRARRAVRSLVELSPTAAHRFEAGVLGEIEAAEIQPGDRLLVKPGERLPADGVVAEGRSWVNEAPLTGESTPVEKHPGDRVYAGSMNGDGSLVVIAERPAAESTLAHIARLVDQAQQSRSPTERFIDRFARHYTPAVIAAAVLLALAPPLAARWGAEWAAAQPAVQWLHRGLVLLVVACPCALVISTPVTIVCALHAAARRGMLIKGGEFLERAAQIDALAFDKTGTLTRGQAEVLRVEPAPGTTAAELLATAAALERRSEHPLARAIVDAAHHAGVDVPQAGEVTALGGLGVRGRIASEIFFAGNRQLFCQPPLAEDTAPGLRESIAALHDKLAHETAATIVLVGSPRRFLGALAIADRPRDDAATAIADLQRLNISPLIMLSGDRDDVVRRVANDLKLDDFRAGLLPAEKLAEVRRLLELHPRLAMVGDGVNDAPALAAAWVGIAFGSQASDTALETADVVVMSPRLAAIAELIGLGRRCRVVLGQNIAAALALKAAVLLAAVVGPAELARLWLAVAADVGATLLVVANGMRLLAEPRGHCSRRQRREYRSDAPRFGSGNLR